MDTTRSDEHVLAWLRLANIPEVGPILGRRLVEGLGSPQAVLQADRQALMKVEGIGEKISGQILVHRHDAYAEQELLRCQKAGIRLLPLDDPAYPEALRNIPDPPLILYSRGEMPSQETPLVAVVGCRSPDEYGRVMAMKIGAGLAEAGIAVVSGLALGIDGIAQEGALKAGGRSIAVLGCGVDVIYPEENKGLYQGCLERGAVLSELPLGTRPAAENFPRRNRIISGLSLAVVIVQVMHERSGALITLRYALDQGREVFVVPDRASSRGGRVLNRLIRQGARLVESAEDILEDLEPRISRATAREGRESEQKASPAPALEEAEQRVYSMIPSASEGQIQADILARGSAMEPAALHAILLRLELAGLIHRLPGNFYVRTEV